MQAQDGRNNFGFLDRDAKNRQTTWNRSLHVTRQNLENFNK